MIADLQDQLHFVRAVQSVDTKGVEPLSAIRDETEEARMESKITVESLNEEFEKEEVVGFSRRIKRKKGVDEKRRKEEEKGEVGNGFSLLKQAPKKSGRFVVVNTKTD